MEEDCDGALTGSAKRDLAAVEDVGTLFCFGFFGRGAELLAEDEEDVLCPNAIRLPRWAPVHVIKVNICPYNTINSSLIIINCIYQ